MNTETVTTKPRVQMRRLMRLHGLTEAQASALAALILGSSS